MAVFVWVCLIFLLVGLYVVSNQEIKETVKEIEQVVRSVERSLQQCHHLLVAEDCFLHDLPFRATRTSYSTMKVYVSPSGGFKPGRAGAVKSSAS